MRKPLLARTGVAILLALLAAAPASARTVVGSPLDVAPNITLGASTPASVGINTVAPSGSTLPINTPAAGVITEVRIRHGATSATPSVLGVRIASGAMPNFSLRRLGNLADKPWPANQPAGYLTLHTTDEYGRMIGAPIAVGESVALLHIGTVGAEPYANTSLAGTLAFGINRPTDGTINGLASGTGNSLIQWIVEPDADGDHYGDETQDTCVGTGGPCLPLAAGPEVIKEVPVIQTVTVTETKEVPVVQTVPSAACVAAREAAARASNTLKKAKAALKKRKTKANSKKVAASKKTLTERESVVKLQC